MSGSKIKLLKVLELINETDADHPYSTQYMADRLTDDGIDAERKAVLRDIYTLRDEYGLSINTVRKKGFFLSERVFEDWELKLLCDAVQGAPFLGEADAASLTERLYSLTGIGGKKTLKSASPVKLSHRTGDRMTKHNIALCLDAISSGRKIVFNYVKTLPEMEKTSRFRTEPVPVSPYALIWRQDTYYLIGNYSETKPLSYYHLDRMTGVEVLNEKAVPKETLLGRDAERKMREFVSDNVYNYSGKVTRVSLSFGPEMLDVVLDEFGSDIRIMRDGDKLKTVVRTSESRGLIYWLMKYAGEIEATSPESVVSAVRERLKKASDAYN